MRSLSFTALFVFLFASSTPCIAQSAEKYFRERILHKPLYLRNFGADNDVHAEWRDGAVHLAAPLGRMLSEIEIDSVKVTGDAIDLRGFRRPLLTGNRVPYSELGRPGLIFIHVGVAASDMQQALSELYSSLFFANRDEAVTAFDLRFSVPREKEEKFSLADRAACDCAQVKTSACTIDHVITGMNGMTQPKLLQKVNPEYTEAARKEHFSGSVAVEFVLGADGKPRNLWVSRAAGLGLDNYAMAAVSHFIFEPATCHGQPVAIPLTMTTTFSYEEY